MELKTASTIGSVLTHGTHPGEKAAISELHLDNVVLKDKALQAQQNCQQAKTLFSDDI